MHSRFATRRLLRSVLSGAALWTVAVAPAAGQDRAGGIVPAGIFSRKEPAPSSRHQVMDTAALGAVSRFRAWPPPGGEVSGGTR